MKYTSENAAVVLAEARHALDKDEPDTIKVERTWRTFAYLRARVLARLLQNTIGAQVYGGPFKGMKLTQDVLVGAYGPYLTGCYEHELHDVFERVIAHPYKHIVNIGCAFGYYAVGLALRMPEITVDAFDTDAGAQQQARDMAALNGVADRVQINGAFHGEDFARYAGHKTLVLMDIEGGEKTLLDLQLYPALRAMDIIVELHDCYDPALSQTVMRRFAATHDIDFVINKAAVFDFEPLTGKAYTDPFDSMLVIWENRDGATPWAVMRAKEGK